MKTISLRRSPTSSGGVPEKKFHPTTSLRLGARSAPRIFGCWLLLLCIGSGFCAEIEKGVALEAGLARRDITPHPPIWLAGYAARNRAADQVDHRLMANALALKDATGSKFVVVGLDNCEVSHQFGGTVVREAEAKHGLPRGAIMIVSSHTHSAPVLENTLEIMAPASEVERERIRQYSQFLRTQLLDVVRGALADLQPARLEFGNGRARFAINRRVYQEDKINFGENPDGPVDWDVPVLKVRGTNDAVRGVIFGYACHGTSISGNDFYKISGDYMAYAREHIESHFPGATAVFLTGMGGDSNPSPRGTLLDAKRHGLELAGAVVGVLSRPMRTVRGPLKFAFAEVELPFREPPTKDQLLQDAQSKDLYIKRRAERFLERLEKGEPLPNSIRLPMAAIRLGSELTFLSMGGEVVVDYALRFKRMFAEDHPWTIGYAYEIPCYIPSIRILKEGGYEAESSLIYYGFYGPFQSRIEHLITEQMRELVGRVRSID